MPGVGHQYVFALTDADETRENPAGRQWLQRPYSFLLTQNDSAYPVGEEIDTFPDVHEWWTAWWSPMVDSHGQQFPLTTVQARAVSQHSEGALNGRALRHYPVDHSILGASAIAVETPDGWVGFTGDMRFHGQQPGLMGEFAQGFSELDLLALIVDGTHTTAGVRPVTENDVYERMMAAAA